MTLEEIFEKYPDEKDGFYRLSRLEALKKHRPDLEEDYILRVIPKCKVDLLKGLKFWGTPDKREIGFIIPVGMIEDADADDWELYEEIK